MRPWLRREQLLCMANGFSTDVVLRGADHASSYPRPGSALSRAGPRLSAALHPLCIGSIAASGPRGTGADFRDLRDRVLWHDGNCFRIYRVQSAATAPAQAQFG